MILKPNMIVKIYSNPITRENLEGEAKLISQYRGDDTGDGLELWIVKFISDNFRCMRTIYTKDNDNE